MYIFHSGKDTVVHENYFKPYYHRKCAAKGCESTEKVKSFTYPKDERVRKQWIERLNVNNVRAKELRACILHFDETTWNYSRLPIDILPNSVKNVEINSSNKVLTTSQILIQEIATKTIPGPFMSEQGESNERGELHKIP